MFSLGSSSYKSGGAARPVGSITAASQISTGQRQQMFRLLGKLGYDVGATLVIITDTSGNPLSSWSRHNEFDADSVATLSATSLIARLALSDLLGSASLNMVIVQEHDNHMLFLLHIATDMAMVVVVEGAAQLGWVRVAARRVGQMIVDLLAADDGAHLTERHA
jgi:predicted regulator of Ras-like GTPase activity (Roadblock/LC7/MglB family)